MILFWLGMVFLLFIAMTFVVWPLLRNNPYSKKNIIISGLLILLITVSSIGIYFKIGSSRGVYEYQIAQRNKHAIDDEIQKMGSVEQIIAKLEQQVAVRDDSRGWLLLGRLYLKTQKFSKAEHAFGRALEQDRDNDEARVGVAEASYWSSNQHLNSQAKFLLQQVLKQDPNNLNALNLLALDAFQNGDYASAIQNWEKMLAQLPVESNEYKVLLSQIAQAHQQTHAGNNASQIIIPVVVKMTDAVRNQVNFADAVFIYAIAKNGPPMPLAVIRKTVQDLPISAQLDESMAMMPNKTLATADTVKVIARISKSGQAMPQPGDFIGENDNVHIQQSIEPVEIIINTEFKK